MNKSTLANATGPSLPRGYEKYATLCSNGTPLASFGFHTSRAQVFRFANRYKVARAFESIQLAGYSAPTNRAYGALFRILLTCSMVEQYQKITKLQWDDVDALIADAKRQQCLLSVRKADTKGKFFAAVCERTTDSKLARVVSQCMAGERNELLPLIRAVRHGFAHGDLAPGADAAAPGVAQKLARLACPSIFEAIESDFEARVDQADA